MPASNITDRSPNYVPASSAAAAAQCLNCHAALTGPFCSQCGQRDVPPHPTVRELAGEAFGELTGWDGKFVETFRLLLTRPGAVTRQFIEGQRVRFISPVRLYLTMSVVYFLLASAAPKLGPSPVEQAGGIQVGILTITNDAKPTKAVGPRVASRAASASLSGGKVDGSLRDSALKQVVRAPWLVKPILQRAVEDPAGLKRNIAESMPRALFALLPVFALILGLFYRRQRYPARLYFAIHLHTVVFILLSVGVLAKFSHVTPLADAAAVLVQLAIVVYAIAALRGMYGGTILRTLAKGLGIAVLYCAVSGIAIYGLTYYAAVMR